MKEFIVWDEARKSFIDYEAINEFNKPSLKDINVFAYIGLNDIDDKKIYADCSIVEVLINHKSSGNRLSAGYFKFNKQHLRYEIIFIDGYMKGKTEFYHLFMSNFKIIDTIQENKLGLIK